MGIALSALQPRQIQDAKRVVAAVIHELWQPPLTVEQLLKQLEQEGEFDDLTEAREHYFTDDGRFLALSDDDRVVGTGAVRRLDAETAELKRMWILPTYRGQGWGVRIANTLLEFAHSVGYKKVRLDVFDPAKQPQAVRLYRRLGFYDIDRYNDGPCQLFMEKIL